MLGPLLLGMGVRLTPKTNHYPACVTTANFVVVGLLNRLTMRRGPKVFGNDGPAPRDGAWLTS